MNVPAQEDKKRENLPFICLFVQFRPSTDWIITHFGEAGFFLLSLLIQMLISSRNTFLDVPRYNVLPLSGHPLA